MTSDPRARICAYNNADYYEILFGAHGIEFLRDATCLFTAQQPPPYMSSMVTLDPLAIDDQKQRVEALRRSCADGFGMKDGFCTLDLTDTGFRVLFEAQWLWATADTFVPSDLAEWYRLSDAHELALWEESWKQSGSPTPEKMFPESLLKREDIAFFGQPGSTGYKAGFILNRSGDAVGLSNVFSTEGIGSDLIRASGATASARYPGLPIVGYDHGTVLDEMIRAGFETVGPLRIWITDGNGNDGSH